MQRNVNNTEKQKHMKKRRKVKENRKNKDYTRGNCFYKKLDA